MPARSCIVLGWLDSRRNELTLLSNARLIELNRANADLSVPARRSSGPRCSCRRARSALRPPRPGPPWGEKETGRERVRSGYM